MKKIISLFLAIVMIAGCLTLSVIAEDKEALADAEYRILVDLGIIPEVRFSDSAPVTREEFAIYAARMLNIDIYDNQDVRYFNDVTMGSLGCGAINSLVEYGCISVGENRIFAPNDNINLQSAVKILTCALGYGTYAELSGGYPNGYMRAAREADIIAATRSGSELSAAEAAKLILNTLKANIYDTSIISEEQIVYSQHKSKTLFSLYHDIYFDEGILEGACGVSLNPDSVVDREAVLLNGELYRTEAGANFASYVGSDVTLYYKSEGTSGIKNVIFIYSAGRNEEVISIEDYKEFKDGAFYYYKNDRLTGKTHYNKAKILYNGGLLDRDINAVLNSLKYGTIAFKDADRDGLYETVMINDYRSFLVNRYDADMQIMYLKDTTGRVSAEEHPEKFELKKYEAYIATDADGKVVDLSEMGDSFVVSVAESKDKSYAEFIVSTESTEVTFTSISSEGIARVKDNEYKFDEDYYQAVKNEIITGKRAYLIFLDAFGRIVYITGSESDGKSYGYLYRIIESEDTFDSVVKAKLFVLSGEHLIYDIAENVKIDNASCKGYSSILAAMPKDAENAALDFQPQIVKYTLNSKGEINSIDTFLNINGDTEKTSLQRVLNSSSIIYKNFRFGYSTMVSGYYSKLFFVPADTDVKTADEDEFSVVPFWTPGFEADTNYDIEAYKHNTDDDYPFIVICRVSDSVVTLGEVMLVESIYESLDDEGNPVSVVRGLIRNTFYEYILPDDVQEAVEIEEGDLVRFGVNQKNEVVKYKYIYDYSADNDGDDSTNPYPNWSGITDTVNQMEAGSYNHIFQVTYGNVSKKRTQVVSWSFKEDGAEDEQYNLATIPVMVYDASRRQDKVYNGTIDDIKDYETYGAECSKIFFKSVYYNGAYAVIYNK